MPPDEPLPLSARLLGLVALLPFLALGAIVALAEDWPRNVGLQAMAGWGAVLLAFAGAVHWGLALAGAARPVPRLLGGALAALWAWAAIALLTPGRGCLTLAVGFALAQAIEECATLGGGYLRLRRLQSVVACGALLVAWLAAVGRG